MESLLRLRAHPSAIWLRQEFPVQRKRIFVLWFIGYYICLGVYIGQKKLAVAGTNACPESFVVFGEDALFTKALGKTLQQHLMGLTIRRCQAVVHPQSFFPGNDQTRLAQIGQVPGGGRLRHIQYVNQFTDAQFSALEQIENPQPSSVGKCPKNRLGLGLSRLGYHIRLHEYIGCLPSGQESDLEKITQPGFATYSTISHPLQRYGQCTYAEYDSGRQRFANGLSSIHLGYQQG